MEKRWFVTVLLSISFLLAGCNSEPEEANPAEATGNPTAEEILLKNPEADIFVFNRIVYSNAEDVDWVNEQELEAEEEVTEIKKQTTDSKKFKSGTATKLPVGTKIYQPAEDGNIYIAVVDGEEVPYLGLIEG